MRHPPLGIVAASASRSVALLSFFAVLLGQGLATALAGSRTGLGLSILWAERIGSFSTQLLVVVAIAEVASLLVASLRSSVTPATLRFGLTALSVASLALYLRAAQTPLPASSLLGSSLLIALLSFAAGAMLVHARELLLASSFGVVGVATVCRVLTSSSLGLDLTRLWQGLFVALALLGTATILAASAIRAVRSEKPAARAALAAALVASAVLTLATMGPQDPDAAFLRVLAGRVTDNLVLVPAPFGDAVWVRGLTWASVASAGALVFTGASWREAVLSLLLLTRGAADIPALGLGIVVAALAAFAATHAGPSAAAQVPSPAQARSTERAAKQHRATS
jgi:hypothetical protein